jgi:branched-chain amino acid transport system permease protein
VISAAYCGLAGALMGHYIGYLHPIMFSGAKSTDLMLPVLVGGQGSLSGTIVASLILFPLLEVLRATMELRLIVYGVVLVLTMLFRPQGLLGRREIQLNFRRWRARTKGMEE